MLNRRVPTILVPTNLNSLNALYEQREDEGEYFMFSLGREDLTILFEAGFFDSINKNTGMLIDEYEEVELSDKHLIQQLIKHLENTIFKNQLGRFYAYKLVILLRKAIKYDVPVFFYL
jgi:hypothetical protein